MWLISTVSTFCIQVPVFFKFILESFPNTLIAFSNYDFSLERQAVFTDRSRVSELRVLVKLIIVERMKCVNRLSVGAVRLDSGTIMWKKKGRLLQLSRSNSLSG